MVVMMSFHAEKCCPCCSMQGRSTQKLGIQPYMEELTGHQIQQKSTGQQSVKNSEDNTCRCIVISFIHSYNVKINAHLYVAHIAPSVWRIVVQVTQTLHYKQHMNALSTNQSARYTNGMVWLTGKTVGSHTDKSGSFIKYTNSKSWVNINK